MIFREKKIEDEIKALKLNWHRLPPKGLKFLAEAEKAFEKGNIAAAHSLIVIAKSYLLVPHDK